MKLYILVLLLICIIVLYRSSYNLPKIVWSFWDKDTPPIISRIIEERQRSMPDWKIILLTNATINNYIDMKSIPPGYNQLKPQHRADWIRLKLLEKYGGLWLDSSIIVNNGQAINEIYNEAITNKVDVAAFTLDKPVAKEYIENWFIMTPAHNHLIRLWLKEYEKAIKMGFVEYRSHIIGQNISISDSIYKKDPKDVYLTQHACLQVVLKNGLLSNTVLLLCPAERNMFKIHVDCNWKYNCIIDNISNNPNVKKLPFIKLRGGEKDIDYKKYFASG